MGEFRDEMLNLYKETQNHTIKIFNQLISITTVLTGTVEIFKIIKHDKYSLPTPLFTNDQFLDIVFTIIFIIVGVLISLLYNTKHKKIYKVAVYIALMQWSYLLLFFIFMLFIGNMNFTWIMIVNTIIQILYVLKKSE